MRFLHNSNRKSWENDRWPVTAVFIHGAPIRSQSFEDDKTMQNLRNQRFRLILNMKTSADRFWSRSVYTCHSFFSFTNTSQTTGFECQNFSTKNYFHWTFDPSTLQERVLVLVLVLVFFSLVFFNSIKSEMSRARWNSIRLHKLHAYCCLNQE